MKFRGFHPEEVSSFLEQIREELEDLLRENAALKEQIHKADAEIHRFWEMRDMLSRTVQDAHQMTEQCRIHARRDADALLEKAEETVRDFVGEAHNKALQLNEEIVELRMHRKEFGYGVRNILSRFETAAEGGNVFQEAQLSDEIVPAVIIDQENKTDVETDISLLTEEQVHVIEGHKGEEGGSEAEQC